MVPKVKPGRQRTTIATPAELIRLLAQAKPWMRTAILLAAHAGMRASDVLATCAQNFNPENGVITFHQKKTGNEAAIPATAELTAAFANAPPTNPGTPILQAYAGRTIKYAALNKAWQRLRKQADANPTLNFHDLRRTVAVALYEVSNDLRVVEQMLGHQSLGATIKYLEHRDPEKLRSVLAQLWTPKGPVQ